MFRFASAVVGLVALLVPRGDTDAITFATAFKAGNADQYKHVKITGTGIAYHGPIKERIADGSTRMSLVVTLGSVTPDGKFSLLRSWEDFVAAERDRSTLVVALSGPDLPSPPAQSAAVVEFSGVYDGQVRTIMRLPQATEGASNDSGPCPGETPAQSGTKGSFYCAPLLTGASATLRR